MKSFFKTSDAFWSRHPALFYGIAASLSFSLSIGCDGPLLILLLIIIGTSAWGWHRLFRRAFLASAVSCSAMIYGLAVYQFPELPSEGEKGTALFTIQSLSSVQNNFGRYWLYKGRIKRFYPEESSTNRCEGRNISCSIQIPMKSTLRRPSADRDYLIDGVLKRGKKGQYYFSFGLSTPWIPVEGTFSYAEDRHTLKKSVKNYISKKIGEASSAEFLSGMMTGEFEDRVMRAEFGRLGLQHLLAISGFHFTLLAGIVAFFLRFLFPRKLMVGIMIVLILTYFLFLGGSPSIIRAWVMSLIGLAGLLFEKKSQALNALGAALFIAIAYDPLLLYSIGFQFSALVTASILIFYDPMSNLLKRFIVVRPLGVAKEMSRFDQHCVCILSLLREALALALAVNITAIPLSLYYFQKFPVLSLLFNLFIPPLVSFGMFFFLVSSLVAVVLPLPGDFLFNFTRQLTHFTLNFIFNTPHTLDVYWKQNEISLIIVLLYLAAVFAIGISSRRQIKIGSSPGINVYPH